MRTILIFLFDITIFILTLSKQLKIFEVTNVCVWVHRGISVISGH